MINRNACFAYFNKSWGNPTVEFLAAELLEIVEHHLVF